MKTRIILVLIVCFVGFIGETLSAQVNYYDSTRVFIEDGYVYRCDVPIWKIVTLYNDSNELTYADYVMNDGSEISEDILFRTVNLIEDDTWTRQTSSSIVNNILSANEKNRVRGDKLFVTLYIDPLSGKVTEVKFGFLAINTYATIPVSTYRAMEKELKKSIWFTTTEIGKQLKYLMVSWTHIVE